MLPYLQTRTEYLRPEGVLHVLLQEARVGPGRGGGGGGHGRHIQLRAGREDCVTVLTVHHWREALKFRSLLLAPSYSTILAISQSLAKQLVRNWVYC